jgi:hypothetical protein
VTAESTFTHDSEIDRIFGPVVQPRTYRNLLYLAVSFPLGILYFVTMITGLSISVGLAIILVGFLMLAITLGLARMFGALERGLTKSLLGATFEPAPPPGRGLRAILTNRHSWSTVIYLLLRFPVGVLGFVASVLTLVSTVVMAAPLLYTIIPYTVIDERITSSEEALLVSVFGCVLFLLMVHAVNGIAAISRRLAEALI